jgi:hypothetical protein
MMARKRVVAKPPVPSRRKVIAKRPTDNRPLLVRHVAAIRRAAAVLARHGVDEARAIEKLAAKLLPR